MAALERTLANVRSGRDMREEAGADDGSDGSDLAGLSRDELVKRAKEEDIQGRSRMSKDELVEALSGS